MPDRLTCRRDSVKASVEEHVTALGPSVCREVAVAEFDCSHT